LLHDAPRPAFLTGDFEIWSHATYGEAAMKDWIPKGTFSNISDKIEPIHVYGVFAAGLLALIEIFAPESISRYLKAAVFIRGRQ
jgi:hypothetical protein